MVGQKNRNDGPDTPEHPSGEEDFDLLALITRIAERQPIGAGQRLSPGLIARVIAALVQTTLPDGVLVTTPAEYDQSREQAYAQGWQDAVQHTRCQLAQAAAETTVPAQQSRPRRLDGTTGSDPGSDPFSDPAGAGSAEAAVLPFPPRIPLVRASDGTGRRELMPHRPRRDRTARKPRTGEEQQD